MATNRWLLWMGLASAGCRVDMGWDVDQGDAAEAQVTVELKPIVFLDADRGDDADARGLFALHSTGRFSVENPHDRWNAARGLLAVLPEGGATFSEVVPTDNVLHFDARFDKVGDVTLQVRRKVWGLMDECRLEVAAATSATVLRRYTDTILDPLPTDLGDRLEVVERGEVGVMVDWRDAQGRALLGKRLLQVHVPRGEAARVQVVEMSQDGATEDSWGDWFNFVAGTPSEAPTHLEIAAGPDVVRTVEVQVHAVSALDDVELVVTDGVVIRDGAVVTEGWLTANAIDDGTRVLAAPLRWYQNGHWVGTGSFAEILHDAPGVQNTIAVCVSPDLSMGGDLHEDTSAPPVPDTDVSDSDAVVDTDVADTDPADTDPADTDAPTVPGIGRSRSFTGPGGEPCARMTLVGHIEAVRGDGFEEPYVCGCNGGPVDASAAAMLLGVLVARRRARPARSRAAHA